jgi:YHS domain-containing protein
LNFSFNCFTIPENLNHKNMNTNSKIKKVFKFLGSLVGLFLIIAIIFALYKHIYPLPMGIHSSVSKSLLSGKAINGYDPVAFFKENKAVKGNKETSYDWNSAKWYFSSQENLDLFKNDPGKYAPQYGGYCAFAVVNGFSAEADPESFEIIDDKLYLCANPEIKDDFKKEGAEAIKKANENWK